MDGKMHTINKRLSEYLIEFLWFLVLRKPVVDEKLLY